MLPSSLKALSTSEANLHDAGFTVAKKIGDEFASHRGGSVRGHHLHRKFGQQRDEIFEFQQVDRDPRLRSLGQFKTGSANQRGRQRDGISSADLAHIFEPFYRVQSVRDNQIRGVGLGLYLVKRMMEDMGGRVSVTSELGRGTEVVLHFPVADLAGPDEKGIARSGKV